MYVSDGTDARRPAGGFGAAGVVAHFKGPFAGAWPIPRGAVANKVAELGVPFPD